MDDTAFEYWTLFEFEDGSREWHRHLEWSAVLDVNEYASGLMIQVNRFPPPEYPKEIRTVQMPKGVWRGGAL